MESNKMYQIENQYGETIGTYPSVTKAYEAVEQYWQCGNAESLAETKKMVRLIDSATVSLCMDPAHRCTIRKA